MQALIGVDTAAEVKVRTGVEAERLLAEDAELKHRHGHRLQFAAQPHFGVARFRSRRDRQVVPGDQTLEAFEGPRRDVLVVLGSGLPVLTPGPGSGVKLIS